MSANGDDPVAIIQARMTSSRLPGKVLMDLAGKPALAFMLERVQRAQRIGRIVVATTINQADDAIAAVCAEMSVDIFRGDEMDVLGRFVGAARWANARSVMRLTADCPMIDPDVVDGAVAIFAEGKHDYVSNCNIRTFPDGLDVEVFTSGALIEADANARHPFLREHVTPYIRGIRKELGAGNFRIGHLLAPANFGHVRWTLDTIADLDRIRELVGRLPENFGWLAALSEATRRPHLLGVPVL